MLYWAEGSKSRNTATLANADPDLVRLFVNFLRGCFGVGGAELSLRLNVYTTNGLTIADVERYWLDRLDLPVTCCRKHSVDYLPTSSSGRKKNRLPFGVCSVSLANTRIVQHIFGAIQEYGGFDEPRWLD